MPAATSFAPETGLARPLNGFQIILASVGGREERRWVMDQVGRGDGLCWACMREVFASGGLFHSARGLGCGQPASRAVFTLYEIDMSIPCRTCLNGYVVFDSRASSWRCCASVKYQEIFMLSCVRHSFRIVLRYMDAVRRRKNPVWVHSSDSRSLARLKTPCISWCTEMRILTGMLANVRFKGS